MVATHDTRFDRDRSFSGVVPVTDKNHLCRPLIRRKIMDQQAGLNVTQLIAVPPPLPVMREREGERGRETFTCVDLYIHTYTRMHI